jgi:hypothetical protein
MSEHEFNQLLQLAQRRRLTPEEEAQARGYLLGHPEAQALWEQEAALNQLLERLPPAPLPSNFTHRVLEAVRAETRSTRSGAHAGWLAVCRRWLPWKAAVAMSVLALCAVLVHHWRQEAERAELARSLEAFSEVAAVSGLDVFRDFEAIRWLHQLPQDVDADFVSAR